MVDVTTMFFLGPLYFIPQLLSFVFTFSIDFTTFIVSGLGTAGWLSLAASIFNVFR
jgi:hypothetical protein